MSKFLDYDGLNYYNSIITPPLAELSSIGKNILPCTLRNNSGSVSGVDYTLNN